jgi:DNA-binding transcriptional MerR regulator
MSCYASVPTITMTNKYSIKDLERITEIKAHTIRIWEKRYNIVQPERTASNIRHYCDDDLKRLLNVSVMVKNGHKISKVATLNNKELSQKILDLNNVHSPERSGQIESLIVSMIEMDEVKFEQVLNSSIIKIGFEDSLFHVIYPLLNKIGVLWQIGSITPSHEHFITNLIRQKLYAAIDGLALDRAEGAKTFLLVLPEWELHDIGLLVYNYLIRKKGHQTIFLGQGIPLVDVIAIKGQTNPDVLVTAFSSPVVKEKMLDYLHELSSNFPDKPIYVGGIQQEKLCDEPTQLIKKFTTAIDFRDKVLSRY